MGIPYLFRNTQGIHKVYSTYTQGILKRAIYIYSIMTLIKQNSGSALTGMVGPIVIAEWMGQTYMRSAPKRKVKNSWSPQQVDHRKRFKAVIAFCKPFRELLIPQIWNGAANRMSGFALFLKTNMPAFAADGSLTDPKLIRLSTGKLPMVEELKAERTAPGSNTINVSWSKSGVLGGIRSKDELMVVSAGNGKYSEITGTGIIRYALNGSFELPLDPPSATHIYLFFGSKDRRDYSESVCFVL